MSEIHNWSTKVKLCRHALAVKVQMKSGATSLKQCHPVKQTKKTNKLEKNPINQASKQTNKQINKQASKQAIEKRNKQTIQKIKKKKHKKIN